MNCVHARGDEEGLPGFWGEVFVYGQMECHFAYYKTTVGCECGRDVVCNGVARVLTLLPSVSEIERK